MLERATACLQASARDSLKRTSKPSRIKRSLHHAFWNHGAGNLPPRPQPFALPLLDLPVKHDSKPPSRARREAVVDTATSSSPASTDGLFLDFLYPPQALLYLHQTRVHALERRRHNGLMQSSRSYSSRVTDRDAFEKMDGEQDREIAEQEALISADEDQEDIVDQYPPSDHHDPEPALADDESAIDSARTVAKFEPVDATPDPADDHIEYNDEETQKSQNMRKKTQGLLLELGIERKTDAEHPDSVHSADGPPEASAADADAINAMINQDLGHRDTPVGKLGLLQRIMAVHGSSSVAQATQEVWEMYSALPEDYQRNLQLKKQLLAWLVRADTESTDARAIDIYLSIPPASRTFFVYESAVKPFLRLRQWDYVFALHEEALANIKNGQQITVNVMRYCLRKNLWRRLYQTLKAHDAFCRRESQWGNLPLLWIKLADDPTLLWHTAELARYVTTDLRKEANSQPPAKEKQKATRERRRQHHIDPLLPKLRIVCKRLCIHMLKPALERLFSGSELRKADQSATLRLIRYLALPGIGPFATFETMLKDCILWQQSATRDIPHKQKEQMHAVISHFYWYYRLMPEGKLEPELQQMWLEHLVRRMQHTWVEQRSSVSVTATMVIEDWQKWHGQFTIDVVDLMLRYSASNGHAEAVNKWSTYLEARFRDYEDLKRSHHSQIRVHLRRRDLPATKAAFESVMRSAKAHGQRPDVGCWSLLIHAHTQMDDAEGAYRTFTELIVGTRLIPDARAFQALMLVHAYRGDLDGVQNLIRQFDQLNGGVHVEGFVLCQLIALTRPGNIDLPAAEQCLSAAVDRSLDGQVEGSLTDCFNVLLMAYARKVDIDAVMRMYRLMRDRGVRISSDTLRPIMQVLCNFRQSNAAWSICKNMVETHGMQPDASHYATVMHGFVLEDEPGKAITAYDHLHDANIRPSITVYKYLLLARSQVERLERDRQFSIQEQEPSAFNQQPLLQALQLLHAIAESITARDIAGTKAITRSRVQDLFVPALNIQAGRANLEIAEELFVESREAARKHNEEPWPTLELSGALLKAFYYSGEDSKVEEYWRLVKALADEIVPLPTVPDFVAMREAAQNKHSGAAQDPDNAAAEVGFGNNSDESTTADASPNAGLGPQPAPGRRHVISSHFQWYLKSLMRQNRPTDAIREFTRLATQGYSFDQITWNRMIEYLCTLDPPLATLAFTLTERFLIDNFPGWTSPKNFKYRPRKSARRVNLQYMRARYVPYHTLIPQYRTMIYLTKAFTQMRDMDAQGYVNLDVGDQSTPEAQQLRRFTGTLKDLVEKAPRTLFACRRMPSIADKWQLRVLKGVGWMENYPGLPYLRQRAAVVNQQRKAAMMEGEQEVDDSGIVQSLAIQESGLMDTVDVDGMADLEAWHEEE